MHFTLSASVATVVALLVAQVAAAPVPGSSELGARAYRGKADPETLKKTEKIFQDALAKAKKNPKSTGPCGGLGCLPGGSWKRDIQKEAAPAVEEAPGLAVRAYGSKTADPETLKKTEQLARAELNKAKNHPKSIGPCGGLGCLPGGSWKRDIQKEAALAVEEAPELAVRAYGSKTADPETLKKTEQLARAELNKAKNHPKSIGPCGGLGCLPGGSWKRDIQKEAAPAVEEAPELAVRAYGSKTADPETLKKTEQLARAELNKAKNHPKSTGPCGGLGCLPGGSWKRGVQE